MFFPIFLTPLPNIRNNRADMMGDSLVDSPHAPDGAPNYTREEEIKRERRRRGFVPTLQKPEP